MKRNLWLLVGSMSVLSTCRHEPVIPQTPVLTFEKNIKAITANNCAQSGCHNGNGEGQMLVSYTQVMDIVEPGKPYNSELFSVITKLTGNAMPPNAPLSDEQIRTIYIWILQGAKEK